MALAKLLIKFFSGEVLEYPEITIPEQGLKQKVLQKTFMSFKT